MKNLKRILSFFIVMGFMFVMFGFRVGVRAEGEQTITCTITSKTEVSVVDTGNIEGLTATYSQTFGTLYQITKDNSATLVISGLAGKTIESIDLSMHSNGSKGTGSLSVKAGSTTLLSFGPSTFANAAWNGAYTTEWSTVSKNMTNTTYTIQNAETLTVTISATVNSLYIQSYVIHYKNGSTTPSVVLNSPDDTNIMVGNTLQLTSSAQNVGEITTDVWASSNTSAATVSNTGLVTPVALGTTDVTRTVNGTTSNAISLKVWPSNTSNISVATALAIAEFAGSSNSPYSYSSAGTVSEVIDANNFTLFDGNDSITVYKTAHGFKSNDQVVVTGKLKKFNSTLEYSNPTVTGYTVTFDTNGGSPSYDTITGLASGAKISNPGTPTKEGYEFSGWYNGNTKWNFDTDTVTSSITLTAKWASNAAQTAINNALESTNAYMSLAYGYTLNKVDAPTTYTKLTSRSQISNGDSVIIVAKYEDSYYALNTTIDGGISTGTSINVSNDSISSYEDNYCWTLVRNNDGTWKLQNGTNYLNLTSSGMACSDTAADFDLHITNDSSYFDIKFDTKIRTPLYRNGTGFKNYASSNIGASGYANMFIFVKQATAKYSVRDVDFRIRCAIDEGLAELNEDYAVTFGIEVTAGGKTVRYTNSDGASFQTSGGKQFVTLDLGDMLNTNYANLDTEFTVKAFVENNGVYFYSTNTKTYSVKGMVNQYYNVEHIDAVEGLKEILEIYGYTFE